MNAQGSTPKETNISIFKESSLTINQHIITLDIPSSKNPPNNIKNPYSSHPTDSVAIDIGRQSQETCPICLGDYLPEELKSSFKCKHGFCSACLIEYLNVKINNNEVLDIPCPQSGCMEVFTEESVKKIIPSKEYKKYRDLVSKKMMFRDRKKTCPQPGCLRLLNPVEGQKFTICECGAKICNACYNLFHEGKSCIEMIDADFGKFVRENGVKFCMMCKTIVMKENGCNSIKCAVCDYQWCWICGRAWNFFHTCPWVWDPIPSTAEKSNDRIWKLSESWKKGSISKRIGIFLGILLLFPVLFVGFVLFLPAYVSNWLNLNTFEFEKRKPIESVCIILGAMLFGILMLPATIICLPIWGFLFAIVFAIYWILFSIYHMIEFLKRKASKRPQKTQLKNRWRLGNPENFVYRPTNPHF